MTPERKKLIETIAQTIWERDRYHRGYPCPKFGEWDELPAAEKHHQWMIAKDTLRAAEDKLNVIVVPNEATEEMQIAGGLGVRVRAIAKDKLNAAIARSPYRREG